MTTGRNQQRLLKKTKMYTISEPGFCSGCNVFARLPTHGGKGHIREEPLHRRLQTWPNVKIPTRWAQNHIKTNGLKTNTNLCLADFPNYKIPKQIMVLNIIQFLLALSADAALFHKFAQRENYMRTRPETVEGKNLPPLTRRCKSFSVTLNIFDRFQDTWHQKLQSRSKTHRHDDTVYDGR